MKKQPATKKRNLWEGVRKATLARMKAEGVTVSDLAKAIAGCDYYDMRRWLKPDSTEPRASIALQLAEWANQAAHKAQNQNAETTT